MLKLHNVRAGYGDVNVLDDVSLEVDEGERYLSLVWRRGDAFLFENHPLACVYLRLLICKNSASCTSFPGQIDM